MGRHTSLKIFRRLKALYPVALEASLLLYPRTGKKSKTTLSFTLVSETIINIYNFQNHRIKQNVSHMPGLFINSLLIID